MPTVTLATSSADAAAVETIEQHHAELSGALAAHVDRVVRTASEASADGAAARGELVRWATRELLPHARAEEATLYAAVRDRDETRLLVTSMTAQHEALAALLERVETAPDDVRAATAAAALRELFELHLRAENELLLPVLAGAPDVPLAELLERMEGEVAIALDGLGDHPHPETTAEEAPGGGHGCGCGGHDEAEPELDARVVPHAIRHATIFGAVDAVQPGRALVLLAPHDPLPLLAQLEQRHPGGFGVEYLERGPETWRLRLTRRAA
jgi:uncharacterized protein (DUF2249 family)